MGALECLPESDADARAYRDNWLRLKAHATPWPAATTDSR